MQFHVFLEPRDHLVRAWCLAAVAVLIALVNGTGPAVAQQLPAGPVRIIVPFPAGGAADFTARLIAQKLGEAWKSNSVVVENQPGANGNVGAAFVSRAVPDGSTLLLSSPGVFTTNRFLYKSMPFDPDSGIIPVSLVIISPNVLVRNADFPADTLQALIDKARANPGQLQYASQGVGSTAHLTGAFMAQTAGVEMVHIPFRGDAPALNAVVAGHVPIMWNTLGSVLPQVRGSKLKALAVGTSERLPALPDVPTAKQAGLAGFESVTWFALAAPGGTPDVITSNISQAVARALRADDVRARLMEVGLQGVGSSPGEMRDYVTAETRKWKGVIVKSDIKPE
jgi:tripartite-type tricarboxylate transporter receptor subunit TctC